MLPHKMKYEETATCVCGHLLLDHSNYEESPLCVSCANELGQMDMWHDFKLDNLKFIEELAKQKGLI